MRKLLTTKGRRWLIVAIVMVSSTEVFLALDLVPVCLILMQSIVTMSLALLLVLPLVIAVLWWSLRGTWRFTTATMLLCLLVMSWPVARIANALQHEVRFAKTQERCFRKLSELSAKQIALSGRYNDGNNDNIVQVLLIGGVASLVMDDDDIPFEFSHISKVDLSSSKFRDEHVDHLLQAGTIEVLDLSWTEVTDTGLAKLVELRSLRELRLHGVEASDSILQRLATELGDLTIVR